MSLYSYFLHLPSFVLLDHLIFLIPVPIYNFSTGKPITGFISNAKERSSLISSLVSLQPSAPANSSACSAFLAPGIGTTFSWATSQFSTTYTDQNLTLSIDRSDKLVLVMTKQQLCSFFWTRWKGDGTSKKTLKEQGWTCVGVLL